MNELCNFDLPAEANPKSEKYLSDCIAQCTFNSGCSFEMLGDGKCDYECNTDFCGWDWGDCGYCANGCYQQELETLDYCIPECNNADCSLQGETCVRYIQGGYCSKDCYREQLDNETCDKVCYNPECRYDNYNSACMECQPWMLHNNQCEFQCYSEEFNYDDWECNCTPYCTFEKQYNQECDWECYNRKCNYDSYSECPDVCSIGCRTDIIPESCVAECLTWKCDYNDNGKCDSRLKLHAFYTQLINQDLESPVFFEDNCLGNHNKCSLDKLGDGNCDIECNNKECGYDLGDCKFVCERGCMKCFEEDGEVGCFECSGDYYLIYTRCVKECYYGFYSTVKMGLKVCEKLPDTSTANEPYIIYVSSQPELDPSSQTGEFEHPFSSLTTALSYIRYKFSRIYLLNYQNTPHLLQTLNLKDFPGSRLSKENSPLNFGVIQFSEIIEIMPYYCNDNISEHCYSPGDKARVLWKGLQSVEIYVQAEMRIKDIEFDGYNIITETSDDIENEYHTYCPYADYDSNQGIYMNDKGQEITWSVASQSDCDRYRDSTLFRVESGSLYLTRVNFINWRAGFFSLILGYKSVIRLDKVDFYNIKSNNSPYSAIISSYECEANSYECGSLDYLYGSVRLLNNGYEYIDNNYFSGFLYAKGILSVGIVGVVFEENLVYKGSSVQQQIFDNTGSLIYIENFLTFTLIDSVFRYSMVDRICYLKMLTSYYHRYTGEFVYTPDYSYDHIFISSCTFTNLYGDIFSIDFLSELPNTSILYCDFEDILYKDYLIDIKLSAYDDIFYSGGFGSLFVIDRMQVVYYTSRRLDFNQINVTRCYGEGSIFYMENLANLLIKSSSISYSLQPLEYITKEEYINDTIYSYLINQNNYISQNLRSDSLSTVIKHTTNACYLHSISGIAIDGLNLSNNYSTSGGTDILTTGLSKHCRLQGITIQNNTAYSRNSGSGLSFLNSLMDIQINNITAYNNTNYLGYGALYYENSREHSLAVQYSTFIENSAAFGSAIAISARYSKLENTLFDKNSVLLSYGVIYFNPINIQESTKFEIYNCEIIRNYIKAGVGGAIAIDNSLNISGLKLRLDIRGSKFISNESKLDASSIYISYQVELENNSSISDSEFIGNKSSRKANILIAHRSGVLTFNNCLFKENESSQAIVMYVASSSNTPQNSCKVIIQNSTFTYNRPLPNSQGALIQLGDSIFRSTLETHFNTFQYNLATAFNIHYSDWLDTNSNFINNQATQAAIAKLSEKSKGKILTLVGLDNISQQRGGLFVIKSKSILQVFNSTLSRNLSHQDGGVVFMNNESNIMFTACEISMNQAWRKGSFLYATECNREISYVVDSKLYRNMSKRGGIISMLNSILSITNSFIYENTDQSIGPGILLAFSSLNITFTQVQDQEGELGSAIYAVSQCQIYIESCIFRDLYTTKKGGAIFSHHSSLYVYRSDFINMNSYEGGSIFAYSEDRVEIRQCRFENSTASYEGGLLKYFGGDIYIIDSMFEIFNGTGIYIEDVKNLYISDSSFKHGTGNIGGAVLCKQCSALSINNSDFFNNSAVIGGALYLSSTITITNSNNTLYSNIFHSNSASSAGSIYSNDINLLLNNNTFISNSANSELNKLEGNGGALQLACYEARECKFDLTGNRFYRNNASKDGGAISWKHFEPVMNNNEFENNTAIYGNDIASFPSRLSLVKDSNQYSQSFNNVAPGQLAPYILLAVLDNLGQIVSTDNFTLAEMSSLNNSVSLYGEIKQAAVKGLFNLSNYLISGPPSSKVLLSIKISEELLLLNIRSEEFMIKPEEVLELYLRECLIGEREYDGRCIPCPVDTYSLDPKEEICSACPVEAICYGGLRVTPQEGYWRASGYTSHFFECPNKDACIGSDNITDIVLTGQCREGYMGNLCATCDTDYVKSFKNTCIECASNVSIVFQLIGSILLASLIFYIIIQSFLRTIINHKSHISVLLKILFNYLQLLILTANIDFKLPNIYLEFMHIQREVASLGQEVLSYDCLISDYDESFTPENIYYIKHVFIVIFPLLLIIILFLIHSIIALFHRNNDVLKEKFILSVITLLFLIHTYIVRHLASIFNCIELEPGEFWIRHSYDIKCWSDTHISFILSLILPGIALWGLAIPNICLFILIKNKKHLDDIKFKMRFGFLIIGYNKRHFYWEFIILYLKMIIIICSTFLSSISSNLEAFTIAVLLTIYFFMQQLLHPFICKKLNEMEKRSVFVAMVSIYSSLFYMTDKMSYLAELILLILIICSNIYFICSWIVNLVHEGRRFIMKVPWLRNILKLKLTDGYSDNLFVSYRRFLSRTNTSEVSIFTGPMSEEHRLENQVIEHDWKGLTETKALYLLVVQQKNMVVPRYSKYILDQSEEINVMA